MLAEALVKVILSSGFLLGVNCYSREGQTLTIFPTDIPPDTSYFSVSNNSITTIPAGSFAGLLALEKVRVNKNSLVNISYDAFCNSSVTNIQLWDNSLSKVPNLTCIGHQLDDLSLWNNEITFLTATDFEPLIILSKLDLGWNKIPRHDILALLSLANSLTTLAIDHNDIDEINDVLPDFTALRELQTSSNPMVNISENVFQKSRNLNSLSCSSCGLTHLRWLPDLCNVTELTTLKLQDNNINLQEMRNMSACKNMKYLDISNNPLDNKENVSSIFASDWPTEQLIETLLMKKTQICLSDIVLDNFHNLIKLDMSENTLEGVPDLNGVGDTLVELILSNNKIATLSENMFNSVVKLGILDLSGNLLSTWDSLGKLLNLTGSLKQLLLNDNPLSGDSDMIWELQRLERLSVAGTNVTCIPQPPTNVAKLTLNIKKIPMNCTCMCWLKIQHNYNMSMDKAPCAEPLQLRGVQWHDIAADCERILSTTSTTETTVTSNTLPDSNTISTQTTATMGAYTEPESVISKTLPITSAATMMTSIHTSISSENKPIGDVTGDISLEWNTWLPWTRCTVSCNQGSRFRLKLCEPSGANEMCTHHLSSTRNISIGYSFDYSECNTSPCPIDGTWGLWSDWSECRVTCGEGLQIRSRRCVGPKYGGKACEGYDSLNDVTTCVRDECPEKVPEKSNSGVKASFKESDFEASHQGIGYMSSFILLSLGVCLLLLDVKAIFADLKQCMKNIKTFVSRRRP